MDFAVGLEKDCTCINVLEDGDEGVDGEGFGGLGAEKGRRIEELNVR